MKWTTVGLFALGLVAAGCAALLVVSLQAGEPAARGPSGGPSVQVPVAVAARDLPAMTVLAQDDVAVRQVDLGAAPEGAFSDSVQIIGKVLLAGVQAGQALSPGSFAADGSALRLAAALPPGRRAVSLMLTDAMSMEGLLYPGCKVDVLATMKLRTGAAEGGGEEPVTITLLQGITVLAVGDRTIVSPGATSDQPVGESGGRQRPNVSLLVDGEQAERLKLAMEEGSVSLVLRNPQDQAQHDLQGTALDSLSPLFLGAPEVPRPLQRQWQTTVLRGGETVNQSFDLPAGGR